MGEEVPVLVYHVSHTWSHHRILACILLAIVIVSSDCTYAVNACTLALHREIVSRTIAVMPGRIGNLLAKNRDQVLKGVLAPEEDPSNRIKHYWNIHGGEGAVPEKIAEEIRDTQEMIKERRSGEEIAFQFGVLAHYIIDINSPLHTDDTDPNETNYHDRYERDFAEHLSNMTFTLTELTKINDPLTHARNTAYWANQFYDDIAQAYNNGGGFRQVETISKQVYNHTMTDISNLWYAAGKGLTSSESNDEPKGKYCGSSESDVYHYPSCHYVDQILPENLIWFDSVEEAKAAGYRPCKVCRPPGASIPTQKPNVARVTSDSLWPTPLPTPSVRMTCAIGRQIAESIPKSIVSWQSRRKT